MLISNKLTNGSIEQRFERLKECEACKTIIPRDSQFCPSCGVNLLDISVCEYCGHKNKVDATVCENCNGLIK
ncbi:MAG: Double zinc ribbon [Candidatus Izimaplasma bacterium HR2]|nr:MAG: Double zinc ribbon [Candidatus Izimaplasma bacterium HR2]